MCVCVHAVFVYVQCVCVCAVRVYSVCCVFHTILYHLNFYSLPLFIFGKPPNLKCGTHIRIYVHNLEDCAELPIRDVSM